MSEVRHYLSELSKEELKPMILYPSELWQDIYEVVAECNGDYAADLIKEILGGEYQEWTKYSDCSYTWWLNIKPGHYREVLNINQYDYFSDDDAKEIKELQAKVKKLSDKVDNLEDCDDYYDKMNEWEDEADELADKIIQIVVKVIKEAEEVTDEQILEDFMCNDMGDNYYWLGDDKTKVYSDYTKSYKTNYKKGE